MAPNSPLKGSRCCWLPCWAEACPTHANKASAAAQAILMLESLLKGRTIPSPGDRRKRAPAVALKPWLGYQENGTTSGLIPMTRREAADGYIPVRKSELATAIAAAHGADPGLGDVFKLL